MRRDELRLRDGSHICVIGGGPAGTLFAHHILRYARVAGLRLHVSIYDGKAFSRTGIVGCNMSAGVIASSFARELRRAGMTIPERVIQRRLHGYRLETAGKTVEIRGDHPNQTILSVYRGSGPHGADGNISFDDFLLDCMRAEGVRVVPRNVREIRLPSRRGEPAEVVVEGSTQGQTEAADLVVGAFGANAPLGGYVASLGFGYRPPRTASSIQAEIELGEDVVGEAFGGVMTVYLLRIPGIRFAAATPKRKHVTVTIVGQDVGHEHLRALLDHPVFRRRLPASIGVLKPSCRCRPRAVAVPASRPYADRLVIVGDAAASRLFKNGLRSCLTTARAAAESAIQFGISSEAFARGYARVHEGIVRDNLYGRALFGLYDAMLTHTWLAETMVDCIEREQRGALRQRRPISDLFWETLAGDLPYAHIWAHLRRPLFYAHILRQGMKLL